MPSPIILTASENLLKFQREVKPITRGGFKFRNTKTSTRVILREMADYSGIMLHLEARILSFCTFYATSLKPEKAVFRKLPGYTAVEDTQTS
jgi:hypothetical protein